MFRFVPRAMLGAVVAVTTVACGGAGAGPANGPEAGGTGGRFRILVPAFEAQGVQPRQAESVANDLRTFIYNQSTHHTAVPAREIQGAVRQHGVGELDAITARQLAQVMNAQLVTWGSVQPGGEGLLANVTVTSVATGDQFEIEGATGANPRALAQAIFTSLNERLQGILMAGNCQDFLSTQEFDRALENCLRALEVLPGNTAALYGAATALFHQEQFEESLRYYQQLLEADPAHQDGLLGAGLAASRLERGQEALGYYNRYLELNPGDVQVRMAVSGQIVEAGDVVSAFRILEPGMQDNIENIDFQQYLAQVATAAGQRVAEQQDADAARPYYDAALRAYERVFADRGEEIEAPVMRQAIAVNLEVGRTDDALRLAQQATQRFPQDAGVWAQYASVLNRAGRAGEEVQALSRVAQIDPQFENVFIRLALAHQRTGNRQQALANFERAAQVGDRALVGQAIFGMAADELRRERWAEADQLLATAAQYAGPNIRGDISFFRGLAAFRQGERIARANTQGRPDPARQALQFFQQALPHLRASNNPQASQVLSATQQYIENQEAIIQAARGR
jgi:tetratricopeptide (TPR) repeat protein